jgi:hypothetical protein
MSNLKQSLGHAVSIGVGSSRAIGPNPFRTTLILSPPTSDRYSVAFGESAVLDRGITIHTGTVPLKLTADEIGDSITKPVNVIGSGVISAGMLETYTA